MLLSGRGDVIYSCTGMVSGDDIDSCVICSLAVADGRGTRLLSNQTDLDRAEFTCQKHMKTQRRATITLDTIEKINNLRSN